MHSVFADVDPDRPYLISVIPAYGQQCGPSWSLPASLQHGGLQRVHFKGGRALKRGEYCKIALTFLSFDGAGPNEAGGRHQEDSDGGLGVAKEIQANQGGRISSDAEERLRDAQ